MPIGELIGLGLGAVGNVIQTENQKNFMQIQYNNQRRLNEQGAQLLS